MNEVVETRIRECASTTDLKMHFRINAYQVTRFTLCNTSCFRVAEPRDHRELRKEIVLPKEYTIIITLCMQLRLMLERL